MMLQLTSESGRQVAMEMSETGIREFERVAAKDWDDDVSLDELLARVNRVASKLFPTGKVEDARVSPVLVARTFRHYTTRGCIDPGRRVGRRVVYGHRQFLQALLVRRLLRDGVPVRRMPELVSGSGNEELKGMILGGVEVVVRSMNEGVSGLEESLPSESVRPETWSRTCVAPGIELHLRGDRPRLKPPELKKLACRVVEVLRHYRS